MTEPVRTGGFLITKIHQVAGRIFNRLLKEHGIADINSGQGRILFVLWQSNNIPISELSAKTQLEKSTLTAMLDRLEKDGFIERIPSPDDRRKVIIRATVKNRNLEKQYLAVSREMIRLFYHNWTEHAIDAFERQLYILLNNLVAEENRKNPDAQEASQN
jgi:DNA-binding MarR family transcriptional regulator